MATGGNRPRPGRRWPLSPHPSTPPSPVRDGVPTLGRKFGHQPISCQFAAHTETDVGSWYAFRYSYTPMCKTSLVRSAPVNLRSAVVAFLMGISVSLLTGQTKAPESATSAAYQNEAVVIEQSEMAFTYQKDGTGEKLVSVRMKVTSEAGARQFSVISLPYAAANESPTLETVAV